MATTKRHTISSAACLICSGCGMKKIGSIVAVCWLLLQRKTIFHHNLSKGEELNGTSVKSRHLMGSRELRVFLVPGQADRHGYVQPVRLGGAALVGRV